MLRSVLCKRIYNHYSFAKENISFVIIILIPVQRETGFIQAKKLAKEKNAVILGNFSGSDWRVPCIGLRQEFLELKVFTHFASKN